MSLDFLPSFPSHPFPSASPFAPPFHPSLPRPMKLRNALLAAAVAAFALAYAPGVSLATAVDRPVASAGGAALQPNCLNEAEDGEGDDAPASDASSQDAEDPGFLEVGSGSEEEGEDASGSGSESENDPLETNQVIKKAVTQNKCAKGGAVVVINNKNHLTREFSVFPRPSRRDRRADPSNFVAPLPPPRAQTTLSRARAAPPPRPPARARARRLARAAPRRSSRARERFGRLDRSSSQHPLPLLRNRRR